MIVAIPNFLFSVELQPFKLSDESKFLDKYKQEKNPVLKRALEEKLIKECPFKRSESGLDVITNEAISLQLISSNDDAKTKNCQSQIDAFSDNMIKTKVLQDKVNNSTGNYSEQEKVAITEGIRNTQIAADSFNNLLQSGCELKNTSGDISNLGNRLINLLEAGATILSVIYPGAALASAVAITSGRVLVGLSTWLFANSKTEHSINEVNESKRFINDLCLFRNLAYKYNDLYNDPFVDPDMELLSRLVIKNKATNLANQMRQCTNAPANETFAKLEIFSKEISTIVEGNASQKQCLLLANKYLIELKPTATNPLEEVAKLNGCQEQKIGPPQNVPAYCKTWETLKNMGSGDLHEKCEDEKFQKQMTTKFTSLVDILFKSVQENQKKVTPNKDLLEKLHELEKEEALATQRYASLAALIQDAPMSQVNSAKSMSLLGGTILGKRFDNFTDATLDSAASNLKQAKKDLKTLLSMKHKSEKIDDQIKKMEAEKIICLNENSFKEKLYIAYNSYIGLKEICDVMKGSGQPPLKSKGFNFDNYSTPKINSDKTLSKKCEKLSQKINPLINEINTERENAHLLKCSL